VFEYKTPACLQGAALKGVRTSFALSHTHTFARRKHICLLRVHFHTVSLGCGIYWPGRRMSKEAGAIYIRGDAHAAQGRFIYLRRPRALGFQDGVLLRLERRLRTRGNGGCVDIERRWLCSCEILGLHLRTFLRARLNATRSFVFFVLFYITFQL
jgi:hypothetical protein